MFLKIRLLYPNPLHHLFLYSHAIAIKYSLYSTFCRNIDPHREICMIGDAFECNANPFEDHQGGGRNLLLRKIATGMPVVTLVPRHPTLF
jgi:hypothetical protein